MADYTRLSTDEIKALLASYNIGELTSISPMEGGQANSSFKLSTGEGHFILSVCDEKNIQEVDYLTQMLFYLEKNNFPTNRLVRLCNKKYFTTHGSKPVFCQKIYRGRGYQDFKFPSADQAWGGNGHPSCRTCFRQYAQKIPLWPGIL